MTIELTGNTIIMTGSCGVEEVETLVAFLEDRSELCVDMSKATAIHTALWQAIMVFRPKIIAADPSSSGNDTIVSGLKAFLADHAGKAPSLA